MRALALLMMVLAACSASSSRSRTSSDGNRTQEDGGTRNTADAGKRADSGTKSPAVAEPICRGALEAVTAGKQCSCEADCGAEESCGTEGTLGLAGGLCLRQCGASAPCPPTTACVETFPGDPLPMCLVECETTEDCPAGQLCIQAGAGGSVCTPTCQAHDDCLVTAFCDAFTGLCMDQADVAPLDESDIGQPCSANSDCRSGSCRSEPSQGYCTANCSVSRQGCPPGSVCGISVTTGADLGICLLQCDVDADCPKETRCFDTPHMSGVGVCWENF